MKLKYSRQVFEKCSRIKLQGSLPSGSLVLCGHADTQADGLTDR